MTSQGDREMALVNKALEITRERNEALSEVERLQKDVRTLEALVAAAVLVRSCPHVLPDSVVSYFDEKGMEYGLFGEKEPFSYYFNLAGWEVPGMGSEGEGR